MDNKKIYYYLKNGGNAVYHYKESGPCFGSGRDIAIDGNPIKENTLDTNQSLLSFDYKGDKKSLSEYQSYYLKALEYEVFQIIFY